MKNKNIINKEIKTENIQFATPRKIRFERIKELNDKLNKLRLQKLKNKNDRQNDLQIEEIEIELKELNTENIKDARLMSRIKNIIQNKIDETKNETWAGSIR